MNNKSPRTLLELLNKYRVEVPIIQRDYAQGRDDDHATRVRLNLLKDMKLAILGETPQLDLNFVYGKIENDKFIPLDGQQRLTTLYLLHIYAFSNDSDKTDILKNFTYETRKSSRDFLEKLNQNREAIFSAKLLPSMEIEDTEWFVPNWKYDPTIQSAITMLDDISKIFSDVEDLAQKLSDENMQPIVFNFLEIENLGMEDSLYIKLNARGKPLTDLEKFKAQLIGRLKELKLDIQDKFEQSLDREWTDLFWTNSKTDFDKAYLNFFGVLFMNKNICSDDTNWSNSIDYEKINNEVYETIFYTLNYIFSNPEAEEVKSSVFNALTDKRTYQDRIIFHGVTTYLYKSNGVDDGTLNKWLRIIRNLTLNSQIDEIKLYRRAIEGIDSISDRFNDLEEYFSESGNISGFSVEQIEEERNKARIILTNPSFADEIYKAEKHEYFNGQIRSALYYSKDDEGEFSKEVFAQYWDKISILFDETKSKYGNLLRRALLTLGDYTLPVSTYKTLCVDDPNESASTPSLKRLFSNHGTLVKQFLDMVDINKDIELQLKEIIENANISQSDWRYCFIKHPFLFHYMSNSHLRLRNTSVGMLIIPNKSSTGYNYEVFLLTLYGILKNKNIDVILEGELGAWADRYISLNNISIRFIDGKYIIKDKDNTIIFETGEDEPITQAEDYIINNIL